MSSLICLKVCTYSRVKHRREWYVLDVVPYTCPDAAVQLTAIVSVNCVNINETVHTPQSNPAKCVPHARTNSTILLLCWYNCCCYFCFTHAAAVAGWRRFLLNYCLCAQASVDHAMFVKCQWKMNEKISGTCVKSRCCCFLRDGRSDVVRKTEWTSD